MLVSAGTAARQVLATGMHGEQLELPLVALKAHLRCDLCFFLINFVDPPAEGLRQVRGGLTAKHSAENFAGAVR